MSTEEKMVVLISSDNQSFEIKEAVAVESVIIKNIIEDDYDGADIPMPNVTAKILSKVIEYLQRHVEAKEDPAEGSADDLKKFDAEFVKVDHDTLFDIILAANYLNIKELLDLMCQTVADMMKDKTLDQIRETFHIKNDYTPEQEAEVRRENSWAFE